MFDAHIDDKLSLFTMKVFFKNSKLTEHQYKKWVKNIRCIKANDEGNIFKKLLATAVFQCIYMP